MTPYQELQAGRTRRRTPPGTRTPAEQAAYTAEMNRRRVSARARAMAVMADRYPDEYRQLYEVELDGIMAEKGPIE